MNKGASLRETGSRASTEPPSSGSLGPTGFDPARFAILIRTVGERRAVGVSYMHDMEHFDEVLDAITPSHLDCEYSALPRELVAEGKDWFQRTIDRAAHLPWVRREALLVLANPIGEE